MILRLAPGRMRPAWRPVCLSISLLATRSVRPQCADGPVRFRRGEDGHRSRSASRVRPQVAPRATGRPPHHVRERCHPLRSRPGAAPAPAVVGGTRGAGDDARYRRGRHKTVRSSPWSDRSQRGFSPCPIQRRPRSDAGSSPIDLSDGRGDVRTAAPSAGRSSDSGRSSNGWRSGRCCQPSWSRARPTAAGLVAAGDLRLQRRCRRDEHDRLPDPRAQACR